MTALEQPVRIGIIGLGAFGQLHARTLAALAEAQVAAFVGRDAARLEHAAGQIHQLHVPRFTDLYTALQQTGIKAWIVASATASHIALGEQLLRAGCTVLMEKPLADSLTEAQRLAPLVPSDSRNLMLGHVVLFNSEFLALKREAATRSPIVHLATSRQRGQDHRTLYPGESPFHLTMVHDLYCVQMLMGGREPVSFTAQRHRHASGETDLTLAQLRWADGALASLSAGFLLPAGAGSQGYDWLEVFGADWAARLNTNPRPLTLWTNQRAEHPLHLEIGLDDAQPTGMLAEQLRCFSRVAAGAQTPPLGTRYGDALQLMRWLDLLEQYASDS